MPRPEWIEVGRIARAHGLHGEVRVSSSSDNPDRFVDGGTVYAVPGRSALARAAALPGAGEPTPVTLEMESVRGTLDSPIVAFVGVDTRDQAEALRGYVLRVPASELPDLEDGEFYSFDLEGLEVRGFDGVRVGVVGEVLETPAHDLLSVVRDSGGEVLVPFTHEIVPTVDMEAGYLVADVERMTLDP